MSEDHRERGALLADYIASYNQARAHHRSVVALRAAKVEAELAYRARGEFLANMNHELRTPLNAISGFATMLKEEGPVSLDIETRREYLDYIIQSADLLLGHINTILELAAVESGGAKMVRHSTSVADILEPVVDGFQPVAEAAGITLALEIDEGLPKLNVDPDRITTAIHHLIDNAISYGRDGDRVRIQARIGRRKGSQGRVFFAIEDTGPGMTDEELARALRAFERVETNMHRARSGTGLGLPIAKSLIELNDGHFDIMSRKGKGTRVRFVLPADAVAAHGTSHDAAPDTQLRPQRRSSDRPQLRKSA